jgi:hypothetical protein
MKNTWRQLFRRLAAGCAISGATAWSSAMCYAVQLAYDDASHSVYNDGWQAGDDGGTGIFGAWNFDGTYTTIPNPNPPPDTIHDPNPGDQQAMDNGLRTGVTGSSPYNNIGKAWTIFNPNAVNPNGAPDNPPSELTDIARVGRSIVGGLPVGATIKMVIDNPTEQSFFRGWAIKLNNGGANVCYAGDNCSTPEYEPDLGTGLIKTRMAIGMFQYSPPNGRWYANWTDDDPDNPPYTGPPLFDTDTDAGMQIEFTLTSADTFDLRMIPLDNPANAFESLGRTIEDGPKMTPTGLPIDWIQLEFFNTDSDFYPTMVPPDPDLPGDYNANGTVDAADYVVWRKHNGTNFLLPNEVESPGMVDEADYMAWRELFGSITARATDFYIRSMEITTPDGGAAIPEPSTFVYMVVGAGLAFHGARRRRGTQDEPPFQN